MMKQFFILFLFFCLCQFSIGQNIEYYFADNEQKDNGRIFCKLRFNDAIIIGGTSFEHSKHQPVIICLDSLGNTLWNTGPEDSSFYSNTYAFPRISHVISGSDGFLYAYCQKDNTDGEFWKLDPLTGVILWRESFTYFYFDRHINNLVDYDSTKFMVSYFYDYDGNNYDAKIAFISKQTGDTLSNHKIGFTNYAKAGMGLTKDNQKYIYYSLSDSIFKAYPNVPDSIVWRIRYNSVSMKHYTHIHFDSILNNIAVFGSTNGLGTARILNLNANNGSVNTMSASQSNNESAGFEDMKVRGDTLFVTWRHSVVGGGSYRFWTTKYNLNTKSVIWNTSYDFNNAGGGQGALSIDLDQANNIFLTGYYDSDNWDPANWAVLKLQGSNGSVIYQQIIKEDSLLNDELSTGNGIFLINNQPCLVGSIQTDHDQDYPASKLAFIKMSNATGNVVLKKYIEGKYQFPSVALGIKKHQNTTFVLKQVGRFVRLEKYDAGKNLMWSRELSRRYFLKAHLFSVSSIGEISVIASSHSESNALPYYSQNNDSILLYKLDNTGNLLQTSKFYSSLPVTPLELYADSAQTYFFYQKGSLYYYRKITATGFGTETSSGITVFAAPAATKYCFNTSSLYYYIFGKVGTVQRVLKVNKSSGSISNIYNLPGPFTTVNYVHELDLNRAVVCGKNGGVESIGLYDIQSTDTIWTKTLSNTSSQVLSCISDVQDNYIYTASQNVNDIVIRKIAVSNGEEKWQTTYNGSANLSDAPLFISIDDVRNELLISGYETGMTNDKNALLIKVDTSGNFIDTTIKEGDFPGNNLGTCNQVLPDGSQWFGGNHNTNQYGLAGFISEFGGPTCASTNASLNVTNCGPYTFNGNTYFASGNYSDTLLNYYGCDSIISLNLTINNIDSSTNLNITNCFSYTFNGITYYSSGNYSDTLTNSSGCDSIIYLNIVINNVDTSVTFSNNILTANAAGAAYQWLDCNTGYSQIAGETNSTFQIFFNGSYAVEIAQNGCVDTSACYLMTNAGIDNHEIDFISVKPNPSGDGIFTIDFTNAKPGNFCFYKVYSINGEILLMGKIDAQRKIIDLSAEPGGMFYLEINNEQNFYSKKLVIVR